MSRSGGRLTELSIGLGLNHDDDSVTLDSDREKLYGDGDGSGALGRDGADIVGVTEDERLSMGEGEASGLISERGEDSKIAGDEVGVVVGRKNDVSNDVSRGSGIAILGAVGEARKIEESYERSVSAAQSDSGIEGLEMLGCSTVEGTVKEEGSLELVGVTEDSVGLEIVEGVFGSDGICIDDPGGDGPGKEMLEMSSILPGGIVEGEGIGSEEGVKSDRRLVDGRDGDALYVDGGRGMSLGSISSYDSSLSDGIDTTTDGALGLSSGLGSSSGVGSRSTMDIALSLGSRSGSGSGTTSTSDSDTSDGVGAGTGQWHCAVS